MTRPVVVVPHDPAWVAAFEALRAVYVASLGDLALAIHHVGSTSVPGLAAKPIIDVDVEIRSREILPSVVRALAALGYRHEGDLGVHGREAFAPESDDVPRDGSGRRQGRRIRRAQGETRAPPSRRSRPLPRGQDGVHRGRARRRPQAVNGSNRLHRSPRPVLHSASREEDWT